jgi:hypothetical protein
MPQPLQVGALQSIGRCAGQAQIIRFFPGQAVADTAVTVAMPAAQMGAGELAIANTVMRMPAKQLRGSRQWPR